MTALTPPLTPRTALAALDKDAVAAGSPYMLAAYLGKKVIHPGGRFSTRRVLKAAELGTATNVLEVGCGVGQMALKLASKAPNAALTGIDINPFMLAQAKQRVAAAGLNSRVNIQEASVEALPFDDGAFDRIVVESVTMFTRLDATLPELHRVLEPGGIVVDHEFMWSSAPTPFRRKLFHRQFGECVCDTPADWVARYEAAGFEDVKVVTGPVLNFTPPGMLIDEGLTFFPMFGRLASRWMFTKRMGSFMWDMNRLIPWIRYGIVTARRA